jgi:hypothetical protein
MTWLVLVLGLEWIVLAIAGLVLATVLAPFLMAALAHPIIVEPVAFGASDTLAFVWQLLTLAALAALAVVAKSLVPVAVLRK